MDTPTSTNHNHSHNEGGFVDFRMHGDHSSSSGVSPLEQQVLDEYTRLAGNMEKLSTALTNLTTTATSSSSSDTPTSPPPHPQQTSNVTAPPPQLTLQIAESLRLLERQVASVYTLMKASVYSIVLQQGDMDMEGDVSRGTGLGEGDLGEESRIG